MVQFACMAQIVNISSGGGSLGRAKEELEKEEGMSPITHMALAYKASKAALNMQTLTLAGALKAEGFTVISMCPGGAQSSMCACSDPCLADDRGIGACNAQPIIHVSRKAADFLLRWYLIDHAAAGWVATDMGNTGSELFGGAKPTLTAETSVEGQLAVIDALTPDKTGWYGNYKGEAIPY